MPIYDLEKEHPSTTLRSPSSHEFVYLWVCDREPIGLEVPESFKSHWLSVIKELPKSSLQFIDPIRYLRVSIRHNWAQPANFGVIFSDNFPHWIPQLLTGSHIAPVIFWGTKNQAALEALCKVAQPLILVPRDEEHQNTLLIHKNNNSAITQNYNELISKLKDEATKTLKITLTEIQAESEEAKKVALDFINGEYNRNQIPFRALQVNLAQLRQIFGQFDEDLWIESPNNFAERPLSLAASFSAVTKALSRVTDFELNGRQYSNAIPSAILAFPSVNPLLKKHFLERLTTLPHSLHKYAKIILAGRTGEQNSNDYKNYISHNVENKEVAGLITLGMENVATYTHFIDFVGYLHASFKFSPYLRAPIKGSSLADLQSFFAPNNFPINAPLKSIQKRINRVANALKDSVHATFTAAIKDYSAGAVVISDLPIEWMHINDVPLAFVKDVCRIPESGITNVLSQFNRNRHTTFKITNKTISKTLVICGASKGDLISEHFDSLESFKYDQDGKAMWKMERCSTRSEVYTLINEFRPELLIFDTHGRFVSNETGTELQIGNEFLTGDDVIKNLPQVPLVVLSACWGAPLYGCSNTIAHAFFETGSLAVTTSLLPLEITKGAMLYTRILRNLKYASEHAMHANWASFMSHNIRTSYFDDLMSVVRKKFGMQAMAATEIHMHRRSEWQLKTMFPNTREEAYKNTLNEVLSCIDPAIAPRAKNLLNQKNYLPEFLFYTTLGRADLVSFDIWDTIKHEPLDTGPSVGAAKNALMQSPQIITTK